MWATFSNIYVAPNSVPHIQRSMSEVPAFRLSFAISVITNIFQFGVCTYESNNGSHPIYNDIWHIMHKVVTYPFKPNSNNKMHSMLYHKHTVTSCLFCLAIQWNLYQVIMHFVIYLTRTWQNHVYSPCRENPPVFKNHRIYRSFYCINSFTHGGCDCNFKLIIFKPISWMDILSISCEIALRWISRDFTSDRKILIQMVVSGNKSPCSEWASC